MTSTNGLPVGPPWEFDVVADVHAEVYPPGQNEELRRLIASDPTGAAMLAALDATVDDISLLPPVRMPQQYAHRLDDALAAEYASWDAHTSRTSTTAGPVARHVTSGGDVVRGGLDALLQPGAPAAPPGLPPIGQRPAGPRPLHRPGIPSQGGPELERTTPVTFPRPATRPPVIPTRLPFGSDERTRQISADELGTRRQPSAADTRVPPAAAPSRPGTARPVTAPPAARPAAAAGPDGRSGRRLGSLEAQRAKRRRWTGGLLAAAAVLAVGTVTTLALVNNKSGDPIAAPTPPGATAPPTGAMAGRFELDPNKIGDSVSKIEQQQPSQGNFTNPVTYAACLGANGVLPTDVTGAADVTFKGQDALAIAVKRADGKVRVVVVGMNCGVNGNADTLDDQITTR